MICTERFLKRSENDYCIYSDIVDEQRRECSMMHKIMPVHIPCHLELAFIQCGFLAKARAYSHLHTYTHSTYIKMGTQTFTCTRTHRHTHTFARSFLFSGDSLDMNVYKSLRGNFPDILISAE